MTRHKGFKRLVEELVELEIRNQASPVENLAIWSGGQRAKSREVAGEGVGWRGRIRTFNPLIQSQVPYRLATRQ